MIDTRQKVYTNLFVYFQNSDFLIVQTALFLMFTYSDTNLLHFIIYNIALHSVITSCLLHTKNHHHGTRLIFISLNILCSTHYFKSKPQSSMISMSCMKNSFLYNMPLSREVWLNIVYIILIWYKAELISPAHYNVHFQYQVKSKAQFSLCTPLCH